MAFIPTTRLDTASRLYPLISNNPHKEPTVRKDIYEMHIKTPIINKRELPLLTDGEPEDNEIATYLRRIVIDLLLPYAMKVESAYAGIPVYDDFILLMTELNHPHLHCVLTQFMRIDSTEWWMKNAYDDVGIIMRTPVFTFLRELYAHQPYESKGIERLCADFIRAVFGRWKNPCKIQNHNKQWLSRIISRFTHLFHTALKKR